MKLLSLEFVTLAIVLILWVRLTRGALRMTGFVIGSALYAGSFLAPLGQLTTALFLLTGYALLRLVEKWPRATVPAVSVMVAGFIYLRGYDIVRSALPEDFWSAALVTAGLS